MMKKSLLFLFLGCFIHASASNEGIFEYWIDNNVSERRSGSLNDNDVADFSFDLSSLTYGVHCFSFRACDNKGRWTVPVTSLFVSVPVKVSENSIVNYEYWIDNNVEKIIRKQPDKDGFLNTDLDISSLSYGIHSLTLRAVDKNGVGSIPVTHYFLKPVSQVEGNRIAGYQYWFNNNHDNAVYESLDKSETPILLDRDLPVSDINFVVTNENISVVEDPDGVKRIATRNLVHTRFKDLNNRWSEIHTDTFAVIMNGPKIDLTGVIINPRADLERTGWDFEGESTIHTDASPENGMYFRLRSSEASMRQTISCLPEGSYTLSAMVRANSGEVVIKANGAESERIHEKGDWQEILVNFKTDGMPFDIEAICGSNSEVCVDIDNWNLWLEMENSGISELLFESTDEYFKAYGITGGIILHNLEGSEVKIFDLNGQEVNRITPKSENELINLPKGIYIVTSRQRSQKVVVP